MTNSRSKIYLAGGFRSGWQEIVKSALVDIDFLDPREHQIQDPKVYTEWDLNAVRECDIVLANMEATNPGGYALALEVGFAKALSKKIVLVDQIVDPNVDRYFEMVRHVADFVFGDLSSAIKHLRESQCKTD